MAIKSNEVIAESLFCEAYSHWWASRMLLKHIKQNGGFIPIGMGHEKKSSSPLINPTTYSYILLISFSVELFFKSLLSLCINGKAYKNKHDYIYLYGLLNDDEMLHLNTIFDRRISDITNIHTLRALAEEDKDMPDSEYFSLKRMIIAMKSPFESWRYLHEMELVPHRLTGIDVLGESLIERILNLRPEWQRHIDAAGAWPVTFLKPGWYIVNQN